MIDSSTQKIIQTIILSCKSYFTESRFHLDREGIQFVVSGDDMSIAINHYKNDQQEVKVLRWFDDFWLYMKVWFMSSESNFPRTFLTISVFQGASDDTVKNQLFRAEWDSFENNLYHPQPHWQVYPHRYHHKIYDDFETFNDLKNDEENSTTAYGFKKLIDLKKIHFAMNAEWAKKGKAIHELTDIDVLINWLQGLLGEIKYQLGYASGKL